MIDLNFGVEKVTEQNFRSLERSRFDVERSGVVDVDVVVDNFGDGFGFLEKV